MLDSLARASERRLPFNCLAALLIALSVAIPSGLFALMAWKERSHALQEGGAAAQRTAHALHEHALRALQTGELLLRHLDRMLAGRSWEDIERDWPLHLELSELARAAPGGVAIALSDASGSIRVASAGAPGQVSIADRDYFKALADTNAQYSIGGPSVGRFTGEKVFPLAIRRSNDAGDFDGVLTIGLSLDYFIAFWEQFAPTIAHIIPLIREDGVLLARYPAEGMPSRIPTNGPFLRQVRDSPSGIYTAVSAVDGIERVNAYTRVGQYPLYVSFSVETGALLEEWRAGLVSRAFLTLLAMGALLALSAVLIRHTRRIGAALAAARDANRSLEAEMARRAQAEETLRQAQKMEVIGQITGGVAHDFNNLLQVLSNNLHLAVRAADDAPRAVGFISAALEAVTRGANLTRQLLAFSRRQPLAPQPVRTEVMLKEMRSLLRTTLGASLKVEIQPGARTWPAMVDRNQAEMAILNLVVNARDAMPGGGMVTISSANVRISRADPALPGLQPGDYVVVSVTDTGSGMKPDVAKRAFEPFFTTKEAGKGSGLGLSQVHGFAAQSGGGVQIDTFPGAGTTVKLYLPRAAEAPSDYAQGAGPIAANDGPCRTVLLVDDDASVREGLAAGLASLGHQVLEASCAEEALDTLALHPEVSTLVTDYMMPGMRGTQLARLAVMAKPLLHVVLISGFADLPEHEAGRWDVLRKPFAPADLAARLAHAPPLREAVA